MIKKIVLITLFVLFAGALIYGAMNRTMATSETTRRIESQKVAINERDPLNEQESFGQGNQGQGQGLGREQGNEGQGQSQGQGQGNPGRGNQDQGQGRNRQVKAAEIQERVTITGDVVQAPGLGIDMILETASGEVLIGTGPGYLAEQGFEIQVGDAVSVDGFWENEEFKATEITLLADDSSIVLRDEWGRPMWAGAGRNAQNRQNDQNGL
jgi:hypothetical protein